MNRFQLLNMDANEDESGDERDTTGLAFVSTIFV